ncbi:DUF2334 domain-containing protein [Haloimpatiens sp. FM7315]|uniref:DUF2334 domain-containing protein n=1 Tax=Haloimpatiens sp. FM7315 TaxID=3298609 RepID=UPI0039773F39
MMFNCFKRILVIILCFLFFSSIVAFGVESNTKLIINSEKNTSEDLKLKNQILLVYDKDSYFGEDKNVVRIIEETLGAFEVKVQRLGVKDYKKEDIFKFSYVFVLGIDGNFNNETFLKDLYEYEGKIFWIGKGVEHFLKDKSKQIKLNLSYFGSVNNITEIYYPGSKDRNMNYNEENKFYLQNEEDYSVLKTIGNLPKVYSYISNGEKYYPFALNSKNFWYISNIKDDDIKFSIFSDLLYDIFNIKNVKRGKVFIRIEDVNSFSDVNKLKKIAEYLNSEEIPFIISLVPTFVDDKSGYVNTISENKDFVDTVKYMVKLGGTVILKGYVQENGNSEELGKGFEFWNGKEDKPIDANMKTFIYNKVELGLRECVENQIFPLGFEAPKDAMDLRGYKEIKKYFSTYLGRYQSSDNKYTTTKLPYMVYNTEAFNKFVPENLGHLEKDNVLSVANIKENFNKISKVRGYTAGVYFHSYLEPEKLKQIVEYFKSREVDFLDLKEEENWVEFGDIKIKSKNGKIEAKYIKKDVSKKDAPKKLGYIASINSVLIVVIGFFCIVFLFIFFVSKKRDKNKFLR